MSSASSKESGPSSGRPPPPPPPAQPAQALPPTEASSASTSMPGTPSLPSLPSLFSFESRAGYSSPTGRPSAAGSSSAEPRSPRVAKRPRLGHGYLGGGGATATASATPGPGMARASPRIAQASLIGEPGLAQRPADGRIRTSSDGNSSPGEHDRTGIETKSLSSSIREHIVENGRRYHAYHAGKYPFPNDEIEQDREEMVHVLLLLLSNGQYFFAPVDELLERGGATVFDLGTGTGIWLIELADRYPKSTWTGIDLSPIQPEMVPPNAHFIVDDLEDENGWDWPENHFDFIHLRHVVYSLRDVKQTMDRIYRHLKPGGWVEIQEFILLPYADDDSLSDTTTYRFRDWCNLIHQGCQALGLGQTFAIIEADRLLADRGFCSVERRSWRCPIGPWPGEVDQNHIGQMMREFILDGLIGYSRRTLIEGLGWTGLQVEMFLLEVRQSLTDPSVHAYLPFHVVYGRKPMAA